MKIIQYIIMGFSAPYMEATSPEPKDPAWMWIIRVLLVLGLFLFWRLS